MVYEQSSIMGEKENLRWLNVDAELRS
jgi:hypothetical protein